MAGMQPHPSGCNIQGASRRQNKRGFKREGSGVTTPLPLFVRSGGDVRGICLTNSSDKEVSDALTREVDRQCA